ncbi:MAG: hypothetical protein LC808_05705 [Actinobacteria bacterium]|nr:hypothetical protein [Actinomycetota bacterium]
MASRITGIWRIVEMDLWDREAIDLVGPAFIRFKADGTGDFRFIAVDGYLHCPDAKRREPPRVDFTWEGNDEGDHASGRGWAQMETDGSLRGHIFFHAGDDSRFRAILEEDSDRTS